MTVSEHSEAHASIVTAGPSATTTDSVGLPGTFRVAMSDGIERHLSPDGELVLLGGDPLRLLRLSRASALVVDALEGGRTVSQAATQGDVSIRSVQRLVRRLLDAGIVHPLFEGVTEHQHAAGSNVTIVVPVKDRPVQLDRLLTSVRSDPESRSCAIVIVDDGSNPESGREIAGVAQRHGAMVIRHDRSYGPARARNAGAAIVDTDYVAFVDSDCQTEAGWLSRCLAHFNDPQVGVVAPRIVAMAQGAKHPLHAYESANSSLDLGAQPARVVPMHRVAYVPSAALVVKRRTFEELDGFNEALHVGEDVDFVWRAHGNHQTVRYEPNARVAHDHRTSWAEFAHRRFQYATSAAPLDQLHPGDVAPLVISPWSMGAWAGIVSQTVPGLISALTLIGYSGAKFPAKLSMLREPGPVAARLVFRGHLGAGRQLASATWRTYLPVALLASLISRRARRWTLATGLFANVLDFRERKPKLNVASYVAIRLIDDVSYCAGLWWGCLTTGNVRPLKPKVVNWPGRRSLTEDS